MADSMNKEQREYIEKIEKDMLESTNMTEQEAIDFAFRCWQCGYGKAKEIRNKAIDEFASKLIMHFADWKMSELHCVIVDTIDQAMEGVNEIAEQMKEV